MKRPSYFNYFMLQESLEQSISQLVVDDDEIDDPAIMTITKRQPIPRVCFFCEHKR